jgi:NAD(P)-dependent dehydrogenase (short-subunit alcohol dehydrogenase family)
VSLGSFLLDGKVAIVTGAGRGLGRREAIGLAKYGARVALASRTEAELAVTAEAIRELGGDPLVLPTDVTDSKQVDRLVAATVERWGRVDVMLANAGIGGTADAKDPAEATDEDWRSTMAINLDSMFYSTRAVIPVMRQQGGGVIITTASGEGMRGGPSWAYGTAKAGVINFTREMAVRLARDNIRVNCIIPGYIAQRTVDEETEDGLRVREGMKRFSPAGRAGEAIEMAPLAVFLASDACSYITGAEFIIDGAGMAAAFAPIDHAPAIAI